MFFQRAIEGCTIYKFYSASDAAEQGDKKRRKGTGLTADICKATRERKQRHTKPCWHYTLQRKTCTSNVCAERVTSALSDSLDAAHAVVSIYCRRKKFIVKSSFLNILLARTQVQVQIP
uniref:Uncharacterized protein n=1 Tax=Trichogramma kaykai TaxID=54128 RepID=A0ABD2VUS4_9HYME